MGRADTDRTHNYVLSTIYELPVGPGKRWLNEGMMGPGHRGLAGQRPVPGAVRFCRSPSTGNGTLLNTPGNTPPSPNLNGDNKVLGGLGPGLLYFESHGLLAAGGPGSRATWRATPAPTARATGNLDMSLFKRFQVGGSGRYGPRSVSTATNVTNSVRWGNPNTGFSTATGNTFGQITSTTGGQRSLRFGGRFRILRRPRSVDRYGFAVLINARPETAGRFFLSEWEWCQPPAPAAPGRDRMRVAITNLERMVRTGPEVLVCRHRRTLWISCSGVKSACRSTQGTSRMGQVPRSTPVTTTIGMCRVTVCAGDFLLQRTIRRARGNPRDRGTTRIRCPLLDFDAAPRHTVSRLVDLEPLEAERNPPPHPAKRGRRLR